MQLSYLKPILCNLKFKLPVPIYLFRLDINGVLKYLLKMGSAREWKEHVFWSFFTLFIYLVFVLMSSTGTKVFSQVG